MYSEPIVTELKSAMVFWPAEDYHRMQAAVSTPTGPVLHT